MINKKTARNCALTSSILLGAAASTLLNQTAVAGPQGQQVVAGQVSFDFSNNQFLITASDGAIIRYSAFDLSPGQLAQFIQPGSDARVLNHIVSATPSSINGDLIANGIVYFVNPAGIIFGNNAQVQVEGGLYAVGGRFKYDDFLQGNDTFYGVKGNVEIHPTAVINAQNAAHFIGRQVINQGTVNVPNGIITMTGHNGTVTISEVNGHYSVHLMHGSDIGSGNFGVDHTGISNAGGGQIVLGAGDMYSAAIRLEGNGISGGNVRFDSNVVLGDDVTVHGDDVTFQGTIDGGHNLVVDGNVIFNNNVGSQDELVGLTVHGSSSIGGDIMTSGNQTYQGAVTLLNDALLAGAQITFQQALDGQFNLVIDGDVAFQGDVGDVESLLSLVVQGAAEVAGNVTSVGDQTYEGAVSILADVVMGGATVHFEQTVDGSFALQIDGNAEFHGDVNLLSLEVIENALVSTQNINTTEHQFYGGSLTFQGETEYNVNSGAGIHAVGQIQADNDLNLNATLLQIDSDVNVAGNGSLDITGQLTAFGNLTADDNIFVNTDGANVFGNVTAIGGNALFQNQSQVGGNVTAGADASFGHNGSVGGNVDAGNDVHFGDVGSVGGNVDAGNDVLFGDEGSVGGNIDAGKDVFFGDEGTVGGNVDAGNDIEFGSHAVVGDLINETDGNVTAGGAVTFDDFATIAGDVAANGGDARFGEHSTVGAGVFAFDNVNFGHHGTVTDDVIAGNNVIFGNEGSVGGNVIAGQNVPFHLVDDDGNGGMPDGSVYFGNKGTVDGFVQAARNVTFQNDGSVGGSVTAIMGDVEFGNDGYVGGTVVAGRDVDFGNRGNVDGNVLAGQFFGGAELGQGIGTGSVTFGRDGTVGGFVFAPDNITFGRDGDIGEDVTALFGNVTFGTRARFGGNISAGQNVALLGRSTFHGNGDRTVIAYQGSIYAEGRVDRLDSGNLRFDAHEQVLLDANVQVHDGGLIVDTPLVRFGGNVMTTDHQTINAATIQSSGNHSTVNSDVLMNGNLELLDAVKVSVGSGDIRFGGTVSGAHNLTAESSGETFITDTVNVRRLNTNGGGTVRLHADVTTAEGMNLQSRLRLEEDVVLINTDGDLIRFGDRIDGARVLVIDNRGGGVRFQGEIGVDERLQSLAIHATDGSQVLFDTGLAETRVLTIGDILFNPDGDVLNLNQGFAIPSATFGSTNGSMTFNSANGDFVMGQYQKLTVMGTLRIEATTGDVYIGDLSSLGDMHVSGNNIWIILREAVDGFDQGVDFVTGGQFFFSVEPGVIGGIDLPRPQFASPDAGADANGTLRGQLIRIFGEAFEASDMRDGTRVVDLRAQGVTTTDLSTSLAAELVDDSETEEVSDEAQLSASDRERLEQVGLTVRDLSVAELAELSLGRGLYLDEEARDRAIGLGAPQDGRYVVSIGRLDSRERGINMVMESFDQIGTTRDGVRLSGTEVGIAFDIAWDNYIDANPEGTATQFPRYLRARLAEAGEDDNVQSEQIAIDIIEQLRIFDRNARALGTTSREVYRVSLEAQFNELGGHDFTSEQLQRAVYGGE